MSNGVVASILADEGIEPADRRQLFLLFVLRLGVEILCNAIASPGLKNVGPLSRDLAIG
jgi:hypothetical protein